MTFVNKKGAEGPSKLKKKIFSPYRVKKPNQPKASMTGMVIQALTNQKSVEPIEQMMAKWQQIAESKENQENLKQEALLAKKKVKKSTKASEAGFEIRCQSIPTAR